MSGISNSSIAMSAPAAPVRRAASFWLWRPWYAKLWWSAIPIWWLGMMIASRVDLLGNLYGSAFGGYLNVLFFPVTALMVLGVGWAREMLKSFPATPISRSNRAVADDQVRNLEESHIVAARSLDAATDIYDPESGALYVGNPLSHQHVGQR